MDVEKKMRFRDQMEKRKSKSEEALKTMPTVTAKRGPLPFGTSSKTRQLFIAKFQRWAVVHIRSIYWSVCG